MRIYFAHPAFTDNQRALKEEFLSVLSLDYGIELIDPFEHGPIIEGDREQKKLMSKAIFKTNIDLMDKCEIMIALIDDRDTGTIFEMGYFYGTNKPIITISGQDYDVNIMLSGAVLAHIPRVLSNIKNLNQIVNNISRTLDL